MDSLKTKYSGPISAVQISFDVPRYEYIQVRNLSSQKYLIDAKEFYIYITCAPMKIPDDDPIEELMVKNFKFDYLEFILRTIVML